MNRDMHPGPGAIQAGRGNPDGKKGAIQEFLRAPRYAPAIILTLFLLAAASAQSAENTPRPGGGAGLSPATLLKQADRPLGLVHFPRCGDPALPVALAQASPQTLMFAQHANPKVVEQLRGAADQAGLLNRRIAVDVCGTDRLLLVGGSADLVVMTDLNAADLTPGLASEIRRVLHPWFGVAILGDSSGVTKAEDLLKWAKAISGGAAPLDGVGGSFVRAEAPPLANADDWTHWWHGPDNNAVSADTAFRPPEAMQWVGKPYFSGRVELPIICAGRLFMLWNSGGLDTSPEGAPRLPSWNGELGFDKPFYDNRSSDNSRIQNTREGPLLTCRAAGSGAWLWSRRLSPAAWFQTARSCMAADARALLVADGGVVLELDQATGKTLREIPSGSGEVRWLAVAEDRVFILGGPQMREFDWRSAELISAYRSDGLVLACLDRQTGKEQWRVARAAGERAFDPRSPAVANGRVFTCTQGGLAEAHDIKTGAPLCKTPIDNTENDLGPYAWDHINRHPVVGYAMEGLYIIARSDRKSSVVLSQDGGEEAWKITRKGRERAPMPLSLDGKIWMGSDALDPKTGAVVRNVGTLERGGCARMTASPQGLFGTCGMAFDFLRDKGINRLPAKSSCGAGSFVANGLAWKFPTPCSDCTEWRGFMIRGGTAPTPPPPQRVSANTPSTPRGDPTGWTSYRGGPARAAAATAAVGRTPKVLWETPPLHSPGQLSAERILLMDPEIVSAPPVVAGNQAILGAGDGVVEAIALDSGRRLWRAFTGGRIHGSPTVWKDRVFAGSADGYLYAFALADGRELWRTRIAPDAARIPLYGQMGSRWPVLSSPLGIGDSAILVSAGLAEGIDGVWVAAVAPATGELLWSQNDWKETGTEGILSGAGQFAFNGTDAIYHGGESPLLRFAPADGKATPALILPDEAEAKKLGVYMRSIQGIYRSAKGQDIGILGAGWTVFGGRRLFIDQSEPGTWRNSLSFHHSGAAKGLPVIQISDSVLMPAWDERGAVFIIEGRKNQELAFIPADALLSLLKEKMEGTPAEPAAKGDSHQLIRTISLKDAASALWRKPLPERGSVRAAVLASDAALVAVGSDKYSRLIAFPRETGEAVWTLPLPETVVYDGLAIAADGTVVVALRDGGLVAVKSDTTENR